MKRPGVVRAIAVGAALLGLATLLWAPALGGIALSGQSQAFFNRLTVRYTQAETAELARLACIEEALGVVPDGSQLLITSKDAYFDQRTAEIAYPRLVPGTSAEEYGVWIDVEPTSGESLVATVCDGFPVEVVRFD